MGKYNVDALMEEKPVDESVVVEVTKDKMLAVISFKPAENGGKNLTIEQVKQKLQEVGVINGVSLDTLSQLIRDKKYSHKYVIAKGTPAIAGQDAKFEFHFDKNIGAHNSLRPKENEDGTVDFKNLDLIQTVEKDQLLMEIIPPTSGELGKNVLGQEIKPMKGKPLRFPKGKNTYESADGLQLFASIEGQLIYERNTITISETYVVSESAGVATGNIDFSGNVMIKGNVEAGFIIKAGGNIEVQGFVGEATMIAGGDIILRHGIQGKDKGKLQAGGDIVAKFIQNSVVEAEGSVYTEAIMHSHVVAGDSVIVEVNKGLIVGGSVQATNLIGAKIIGSPMSTATTIQISITPSLHNKHRSVESVLSQKRQQLSQVQKNINFINTKLAQGVNLPKERVAQCRQLLELQKKLVEEIQDKQKEYEGLEELLQNYKEGSIKIRDVIYPGCKVIMGSNMKYIKEDLKYCTIMIEDREIKVGSYM